MPTNTLIVSSIVLMLVLVLSSAQGQHVGERCTIDDYGSSSPGICKGLRDCPVVYNQLLAGISPRKGCGYRGFEPIICCPTEPVTVTEQPTVTQTSQVETSTKRLTFDRNVRGSLARAKCQENAEAVYILETPPTLLLNQPPVNRSLCAVESRKLIVGGKKADPKEFPHMVALGYDGRDKGILWWCGGTLISDKVVLTAAHCLHSEWGGIKWARVGDLNLARTDDEARPQTIKVVQTIQHPDYKPPAEYHDIAILKLQEAVTYDAWVRPACLPVDLPDEGNDNKAVATGWGRQDWSDEEGSDDLMKVTLNLVKHKDCKKVADGSNVSKLPRGVINEWQLCAGELGKDTCQGDSGGPLAIFHKDHYCVYNVIGVTSIGVVCGNFLPGLYTRVYNYIPWIEQNAWPEYF